MYVHNKDNKINNYRSFIHYLEIISIDPGHTTTSTSSTTGVFTMEGKLHYNTCRNMLV